MMSRSVSVFMAFQAAGRPALFIHTRPMYHSRPLTDTAQTWRDDVKIATTLILIGLVTSPAYSQGIHLVQRETRNGQVTTNNVLLDRTHMRAESRSANEQVAFVFDGSAQVARMINLDKKTYFEMTRAQAQQMGQQADSAMAAMQEQLKNMPPEQRQMVEQMMRARGLGAGPARGSGPPAAERIEYRRSGTDKVAQFPCTKYEGYRGQAKVVETLRRRAARPRTDSRGFRSDATVRRVHKDPDATGRGANPNVRIR